MNLSRRPPFARVGFTLIELLVVIAIIAVLVGLIVPASMNIIKKGPEVTTAAEIRKMETSIQAFQAEFKVGHIPSRIKLCTKLSDYNKANPLDADSMDYMLKLFPRAAEKWQTVGIDWSGNGSNAPVVLEGHQCLVFFLGGVPLHNPPGCFGWSGNQKDPADRTATQGRKGPYYEFEAGRLIDKNGNGFYCYKDPYSTGDPAKDQAYAYFSSYGHNNHLIYGTSDCASLGIQPYVERQAPLQFHRPKEYQIISAGANRVFGQGGMWSPANAGQIGQAGRDDQTSFYRSLMGVSE